MYLRPDRDRPRGAAMEVGQRLPDVVLEGTKPDDSPFLRAERAEAQRALLGELAAARLGGAAEGLKPLLVDVDDPELLARVGRRLMEGASATDLTDMLVGRGPVPGHGHAA